MPMYEYQCKKCNEVTEAIQSFSDSPLKKCPLCGGKANKIMSRNTFHLKGSGWYVTDYADNKKPKSGEPTNPPSKTPDDSSSVTAPKKETKGKEKSKTKTKDK